MTDIETKALIERLRQRSNSKYMLMSDPPKPALDADCHMAADLLQEALAFKQEVSDAVENEWVTLHYSTQRNLSHLIIPKPKPDPLVEVAESLGYFNTAAQGWAGDVRAALEARGLEIREKGETK